MKCWRMTKTITEFSFVITLKLQFNWQTTNKTIEKCRSQEFVLFKKSKIVWTQALTFSKTMLWTLYQTLLLKFGRWILLICDCSANCSFCNSRLSVKHCKRSYSIDDDGLLYFWEDLNANINVAHELVLSDIWDENPGRNQINQERRSLQERQVLVIELSAISNASSALDCQSISINESIIASVQILTSIVSYWDEYKDCLRISSESVNFMQVIASGSFATHGSIETFDIDDAENKMLFCIQEYNPELAVFLIDEEN